MAQNLAIDEVVATERATHLQDAPMNISALTMTRCAPSMPTTSSTTSNSFPAAA